MDDRDPNRRDEPETGDRDERVGPPGRERGEPGDPLGDESRVEERSPGSAEVGARDPDRGRGDPFPEPEKSKTPSGKKRPTGGIEESDPATGL